MKTDGHNIERKRSWREECFKWVCGFANAAGALGPDGFHEDRLNVVL